MLCLGEKSSTVYAVGFHDTSTVRHLRKLGFLHYIKKSAFQIAQRR
jgi:hypothetical protein